VSRLGALRDYLAADPENLTLLADAANVAFDEADFDEARNFLARYHAIEILPQSLVNLEGLIALRTGRLDDAAAKFDSLIKQGVNEPSVCFNRAWIHALNAEHEAALALLDNRTSMVTPRAQALKVQTLHHLGRIDEALAVGADMAAQNPDNDLLLGALSVAAMDADNLDLARRYAAQAKGGADALTTRGLIALDEGDLGGSQALFENALAEHSDAPRAWLGKGLGHIAAGQIPEGTAALTKGAEIFGDHLGSWIALGWTQFIARDNKAARATFERALALDENFAETHGGLAVLDLADGDIDGAQRRSAIALRLDRNCFGGMLSKMLLLEAQGDADAARRIWDKAINLPAGADGKTLAQAMIGLGLNPARGSAL
jgi:tetratricopeptide (TPR) repeat protein